MRKLASRSIFWLAIAILVENVARMVIEDGGMLNLTSLILIWIASAIASGSTTACRWAVFFMGLYVGVGSFGVYELVTDPPGETGRNVPLPVDIGLSVVISLWSVGNLILAVRVLREANHAVLSPLARKVAIGCAILLGLVLVVRYVATPSYARPDAIEERYSEQVAFLRNVAATGQEVSQGSPEVRAVFDEHPEILEAEVQTGPNTFTSIVSLRVRESFVWFERFGTGEDEDGTEFPIIIYTGWARNAEGERVQIRMTIQDI